MAYYKKTRTSQIKNNNDKKKYNDNSPMGIEGRIIFLILLALKQLNHSTI
jgi:hypothetical protein